MSQQLTITFQDPQPVLFQEGCDIIAYSTAISACEKAYQWQAAMSLLFNTLLAKMKMDLIAYSATISACEKCQQWQYALLLFHEIKAGSHVDLITYNSVISACENAGKWQEALELLFEAEDVSLKTTTMTYNVAISACEKGHTWKLGSFDVLLSADLTLRIHGTIVYLPTWMVGFNGKLW